MHHQRPHLLPSPSPGGAELSPTENAISFCICGGSPARSRWMDAHSLPSRLHPVFQHRGVQVALNRVCLLQAAVPMVKLAAGRCRKTKLSS